jgi:hypothetical protein
MNGFRLYQLSELQACMLVSSSGLLLLVGFLLGDS